LPRPPAHVAARRCLDYPRAGEALAEALVDLGLGGVFAGRLVALKVNLMHGTPPGEARTTHPEFLRAVIRLVREGGGRARVVESSGIIGFTPEVLEATGVAAVAREEGAEVVNLDGGPFRRVPVPGGRYLTELLVAESLFECDLRVTLPKLKTHDLTTLTCALKNQVGILPGGTKCNMHQPADTPAKLAVAVAEIAEAVPFDLALVDAVVGLHGGGSRRGRPAPSGFVAAGRDLVAVDAVCGALVGIPPEEVAVTCVAAAKGLGEARLDRIRLSGLPSFEPLLRFERAGWDAKRLGPVARVAYHLRETLVAPVIDRDACTGTGDCAAICPVGAISMSPLPRISDACVHCHACRAVCPEGAVRLKPRPGMKTALRLRARGLTLEL
jgi:uncharacterized protein (DUF362 family)/ferredoxin